MLTQLLVLTSLLLPPNLFFQPKKVVTAQDVVTEVQKFYKSTTNLTAKFRQTTLAKAFGRKEVSDGMVYIKKPGKMRWDYSKQDKRTKKLVQEKSFLSDGKQLWAVNHRQKQYYEQNIKDNLLPVAVTFLTGKGDLNKEFTAILVPAGKYGGKNDLVVQLTPNKPNAQYKTLWLVVDPSNYRVKQSVVENSAGDTNQFAFYEPNTTADIKATLFVFNAKAAKDYRKVTP
jgi:outer membrane lipoprotein carrier protein